MDSVEISETSSLLDESNLNSNKDRHLCSKLVRTAMFVLILSLLAIVVVYKNDILKNMNTSLSGDDSQHHVEINSKLELQLGTDSSGNSLKSLSLEDCARLSCSNFDDCLYCCIINDYGTYTECYYACFEPHAVGLCSHT